ncbi:DNA-binding protein H-NS [Paraburkholderia sp. GAS33]|jgi:DNA-binding protein H-NS|uniref:H-NS histone family protein n=1 Tax=Paraburkholderia sp. GAS33 TaxID=3035130 RepID=UPI003D21FE10
MQIYQQIDAEFAQYEAEAAALQLRMDALTQRRESIRQQAHDQALPEIVERMTTHGITLEQVRAALAAAKPAATVIHKYWDPETEETHSGKGTIPGWLVGKTGRGRTGDPRYLNPAWVAKEDAKDAAKAAEKQGKKNKTKSSGASVADQALSSNVAVTVPNDAPEIVDGAQRPAPNDGAPIPVANVAAVDMAHVETKTASAPIVSNLN